MSKTFKQIKREIEQEFIGGNYGGTTATEEILTEIIGKPVEWYDSVIDDGVDDDETEDEYIIKECFSTKDDKIIVRIYYGNVTDEIGYVTVDKH